MKADLCHMNFQYLDFGEIDALDKFHNADVAVVDMSIHIQQASLFYHIGMRENMGMPETIILLNDTDPEFTLSVKVFSTFLAISEAKNCLLGLYWTRLTLLSGFPFLVIFFYFGLCGRLSWLKCQLLSAR